MIVPTALPDFFATTATSKSRSHLAAWTLLLGALSNQALADERNYCQVTGPAGQALSISLPQRLEIDNDLPNGHVLFDVSAAGSPFTLHCQRGAILSSGYINPMTPYNGPIYQTTVPGIGVEVTMLNSVPVYATWPRSTFGVIAQPINYYPFYRVSLKKIGHITPGTLRLPSPLAQNLGPALVLSSLRLSNAQTEVVERNPTCSVDAGSRLIPVFLGDHPRAIFNGVNFTTPAVPFSITLNCSGGGAGSSQNVRFSITDAHFPQNRTQALRLAPGAGAAGVGIRIRHHLNGGTSNIALGSSLTAGTVYPGVSRFEIHLSAQYIQQVPPSQVREGLAPARASFTITYN
jgi:type 1 fimbria pilin